MASTSTLSLTQIGIRREVCCECETRTPGDTGDCCYRCESACSVFLLLPRILDLVLRHKGEPPCGYGFAVRNLLRHVQESRAFGSGSIEAAAASLDRHAEATIAVVQQVLSQET